MNKNYLKVAAFQGKAIVKNPDHAKTSTLLKTFIRYSSDSPTIKKIV